MNTIEPRLSVRPAQRADIQSLRAIAVLAVLGYHLWPSRLPGGFIGVDVFFVISGYLIVGSLVRELEMTGRVRLWQFWSRRARRLLPAALLVLACTVVVVVVFVPLNLWPHFLRDVIASTLYVENWALAADATDYWAEGNAQSPLQHFWSLSVEEQFYIAAPLLLIAVTAVHHGRRTLLAAVLLLTLASFVFSIWFTVQNPSGAYFNTGTRAWEFGIGALVGFIPALARGWIPWVVGAVMTAASLVAITSAAPFPSWTAAFPAVGAALMIAGGRNLGKLQSLVENRAAVFIGGISYSVYLWHWGIIVLLPYVTGHPLTTAEKIAILLGTVLLAWASTRWIEDPIRFSSKLLGGRRPMTITAWTAAGMLIVVTLAGCGISSYDTRRSEAFEIPTAAEDPACFGASAALRPQLCTDPGTITPDPAFATEDDSNQSGCWAGLDDPTLNVCTLGDPDAGIRMIAIGDSHNNMLVGAYEQISSDTGWRIDIAGHNSCYLTRAVQVKPLPSQVAACETWKKSLRQYLLATPYDVMLVTNARYGLPPATPTPEADATAGLIAEWQPYLDAGTRIIAIEDVPRLRHDIVTCVTINRQNPDICGSSPTDAIGGHDALLEAAAATGVPVVPTRDLYCTDSLCRAVVGGVMVYLNEDHVTGTWARTLAPVLADRISRLLP